MNIRFGRGLLIIPAMAMILLFAGCPRAGTTLSPLPVVTQTPSPAIPPEKTPIVPLPSPTPKPSPVVSPVAISWESLNGPSGGRIFQLIQNPAGKHELYALSANGVFKSENKGESWNLIDKSDKIGANAIAVHKDKLFVASDNGAFCFEGDKDPEKVFKPGCRYLMVSGDKLFVTILYPDRTCPGIYYTELAPGIFNWQDITPTTSELNDLRLPKNSSFWHNITARNIVVCENRILANIVMEIEGSGIETNGGLYVSEDRGETWSRTKLDVPADVIASNIIQDPGDSKHIFATFRHPVMHDYTYPESELIRESFDGGRTWLRMTEFSQPSNGITDVSNLGPTHYLINPYSGFILKLEGSTQKMLSMPMIDSFPGAVFNLDALFFDKDNPDIVFGKCGTPWAYGLVKSLDNMKTWQKMDTGIVASSPNVIVTDPKNPEIVFTSGNVVQEKYCTRDGGKTWEPFSPTVAGNELKVDPHNPDHMILIDEMTRIYESFDGGKTFAQICINFSSAKTPSLAINPADPNKIFVSNIGTGISEYLGQSNWQYRTGSPDYAYDIVFDPEDGNILYATYSPKIFENYSSIWRYDRNVSENYGWKEILRLENTKGFTSLEFDRSNPKRMYAGVIGEGGTIYVSNDKGDSWSKLNEDLTFTTIWGHSQLQIDPHDKNTVYAGTWGGGTYKTVNGGQSWQLLDINQTFSPTAIAISDTNPNIIYACDRTAALIHRSDDAGQTWYNYFDFGPEYMLSSAVAVDPQNPNTIYASAFKPPLAHRGAFVKLEEGKKVDDLGFDLPRSVLDIEIDKQTPQTIYVTTHIYGVFKSTDGGKNFLRLDDRGTGLPRTGFYDIDLDPVDNKVLYATALSGALPDYMMPSPDFPNLEGQSGVYKSTDAGDHWSFVLATVSEARGISIDPENNSNLFVADMMGGVWVSNDAGQHWRQENRGLGSISMTSVKISGGNIYASTQGSGVYSGTINSDNSITWDLSRSNKPKALVSKILIKVDPSNSSKVYASAYPGGLLRSDDGGKHWNDKNFLTPSIKVEDPTMQGYYSFDIGRQNPNVIWLGAYGKGMYVSYDGMDYDMTANGDNRIMAGKHITDVRIDPADENTVWIGTQEGIFVTRDSGKHWEAMDKGLETRDIKTLRVENIPIPPFGDDFESGNSQRWNVRDTSGQPTDKFWSVIQDSGNHVFEGIEHSFAEAGSRSWGDYTFSARIKLVQGGIHINARVCEEGRYFIAFSPGGLVLNKQYDQWRKFSNSLVTVPGDLYTNQWVDLKIEVNGANIKVYLDGVLKIQYTDSSPVLQGAIAFETLPNSRALVDDVSVQAKQAGSQVYCGTAGYGIYKLNSATLEWQNMGRTLGIGYWSPWERRMYQFASILFDPDVAGKVYYGNFPGGFFISEDNGHTWRDSSLGLGNDGIFSSVIMHPQDHSILFAGSYNGIVKSVNGGKTWVMKSSGMPSEQWAYTVAIDDRNPSIMYASTKNGQNKGFAHRNTFSGVVMKSVNGGENWSRIMNGLDERSEFYTLIIYPPNHDVLFLSTNKGVYVSRDGGNSWQTANNGLPSINNQVRDNVAQNLALTPDNKYLVLGLVDYGVWKADISKLKPSQ